MELFSGDVNILYSHLMSLAPHRAYWERTRNGNALVFPTPILIHHHMPWRRVLFDPIRDANPFFHYMEAIWMLSGSNNVEFPSSFAANIKNYSDDGVTLHGAYGYRWRYSFGVDQISEVIKMIQNEPSTRKAVITMWNPEWDLNDPSKDLPCNTHIYFRKRQQFLDMTVCNRSNDLVWGCLGANVVHMSILHEYIANAVDSEVGVYSQFTNNLHIYDGWEDKFSPDPDPWYEEHPEYRGTPFSPATLSRKQAEDFVLNREVKTSLHEGMGKILRNNGGPMTWAYRAYKEGKMDIAMNWVSQIKDDDWREACNRWLLRRIKDV